MAGGVRVLRVSFAVFEFSSVGVIASLGSSTEGQEISSEASTRNPNPNTFCAQLVPRPSTARYGSSVPPPSLCPKDSFNGQDGAELERVQVATLTLATDQESRPLRSPRPPLALRHLPLLAAAPYALGEAPFRFPSLRAAARQDRLPFAQIPAPRVLPASCKLASSSPPHSSSRGARYKLGLGLETRSASPGAWDRRRCCCRPMSGEKKKKKPNPNVVRVRVRKTRCAR